MVILRDAENQRALPIMVGPVEANAIAIQLENSAPMRPMTHDLMRALLDELGGELVRVVISELREGTFFAYLDLRRAGERVLIDSRPSDALALALRSRAPIFVESDVLDQAKAIDAPGDRPDRDHLQKWLESLNPDDLGYKM
jgi:hypothetical protein